MIITKEKINSDLSPLGLLSLGMSTVILNVHNIGMIPVSPMLLGMGFFYGGIAQIIAGFFEWKNENTFGMVTFFSYGFFWLSLVTIFFLQALSITVPMDSITWIVYLVLWGLLTLSLFLASLRLQKLFQFIFGMLTIVYALAILGHVMDNIEIAHISAYLGIICGFFAMYAGMASLVNGVHKKNILPII